MSFLWYAHCSVPFNTVFGYTSTLLVSCRTFFSTTARGLNSCMVVFTFTVWCSRPPAISIARYLNPVLMTERISSRDLLQCSVLKQAIASQLFINLFLQRSSAEGRSFCPPLMAGVLPDKIEMKSKVTTAVGSSVLSCLQPDFKTSRNIRWCKCIWEWLGCTEEEETHAVRLWKSYWEWI